VLAHWITDRDLPRRFDVPFLVARMPEGQQPVADEAEQFEPLWVRPADALARHKAGQFFMIFPTIRTLERMQASSPRRRGAGRLRGEKPLWTSCPRAGLLGGKEARYMEGDTPFGELALVCPDGQIVHHAGLAGRAAGAAAEERDAAHRAQPGRDDRARHQHLHRRRRRHRLHRHRPGSGRRAAPATPAAGHGRRHPADRLHALAPRPLARRQAAAGRCARTAADPGPGLAPTSRPASAFTPDRELADGECCRVPGGGQAHSLRVIHTPGHAANHLCLVLVEDGLLFSGDHILNGSTTIVDPPDGDMTAYLDSLDRLTAACREFGIDFILPAHGYVLGFAPMPSPT
jgi:recombination protein RecT